MERTVTDMSLNATPSSERLHIGIFGKRNAGKSSLINALTGQNLAIVSDIKGTTTDPVLKSMELLPLGPVVLIDTPGLDDHGPLGELRVQKTYQMLNKTDIAILVVDGTIGMTEEDLALLEQIQKKQIPYVIAFNKCDLARLANPRCQIRLQTPRKTDQLFLSVLPPDFRFLHSKTCSAQSSQAKKQNFRSSAICSPPWIL